MNSAIILGAGRGSRMKAPINKQYMKIKGKEIIRWSIEAFLNSKKTDEIIIVVANGEEDEIKRLLTREEEKFIKIVVGGQRRQDSVYKGLLAMNDNKGSVLIHDGARPLISSETIDLVWDFLKEKRAAIVGVPVKDTIKIVSEKKEVIDTPNREFLWSVQTPQGFDKDLIIRAHKNAQVNKIEVTDDSMMVELLGEKVSMIMGSYENIKITTQEDLDIAESILNRREF